MRCVWLHESNLLGETLKEVKNIENIIQKDLEALWHSWGHLFLSCHRHGLTTSRHKRKNVQKDKQNKTFGGITISEYEEYVYHLENMETWIHCKSHQEIKHLTIYPVRPTHLPIHHKYLCCLSWPPKISSNIWFSW